MHIGIIENDSTFRDEAMLRLRKLPGKPKISYWQSAENYLKDKQGKNLDLLILDIMLPGISGIDLARKLNEQKSDIKILVLTNMNSENLIFEAIQYGAIGYALKSELSTLTEIVQTILDGGAILTPTIALRVLSAGHAKNPLEEKKAALLTSRQREILDQMVSGLTVSEAAEELGLSPHTVQTHVKEIYKKLNVHNRVELVGKAMKMKK